MKGLQHYCMNQIKISHLPKAAGA